MKTSHYLSSVLFFYTILIIGLMTSCEPSDLVEPKKEFLSNDYKNPDLRMITQGKLNQEFDKGEIEMNEIVYSKSSFGQRNMKFAIYQMMDFKMVKQEYEVPAKTLRNTYVKDESSSQSSSDLVKPEMIHITGVGKGWSDEFGMSLVSAEMDIIPGTMRLTGALKIELFDSGSTLQIKLLGDEPLQTINDFDGPHLGLVLKSSYVSGTGEFKDVKMDAVTYFLNASELLKPELTQFNSYLMTVGEMTKE